MQCLLSILTAVFVAFGIVPPQPAAVSPTPVDPVVQWNRILLGIVRTQGVQPATIHPTRSFAIMHAAILDAVTAIDRRSRPYAVDASSLGLDNVSRFASQDAAADAAAHEVLITLYASQRAALDAAFQEALQSLPDNQDRADGVRIGQLVADRILELRSHDKADAPPIPYVFGTQPGDYQSTPPNNPPQPQFTQWRFVTPFVLAHAAQFRPGPPPALTSRRYARDLNDIQAIGVVDSGAATVDQELIGRFWNGAIQNYWNEIAQSASIAHHLSTAESARLFATMNVALADAVIALYDAKYTYNRWRPVTAIRAADHDGNQATNVDPNWLPEVTRTPPDPTYPGAHAVVSAAASAVLIAFFHSDRIDLTVTSEVLPNETRSFDSFSGAAKEASVSRVFAGVHFRADEDAGDRLGLAVAAFTITRLGFPHER
jgi:hypothetical protein